MIEIDEQVVSTLGGYNALMSRSQIVRYNNFMVENLYMDRNRIILRKIEMLKIRFTMACRNQYGGNEQDLLCNAHQEYDAFLSKMYTISKEWYKNDCKEINKRHEEFCNGLNPEMRKES